jgi:hypothetical protein
MTIIISKHGQNAQKIDKSSIENEDYLQRYIYENPDSIPLYEIREDIRLLILAREFPTESGPIDALAVDNEGGLYIVETKLYSNADKRLVVAQALDYGASLWKHTENFNSFMGRLDRFTQQVFKLSTREKLAEFFELDDSGVAQLTEQISLNLNDGNIKFVILMDRFDERLKDLIMYVNQNSKFDIYAVQFDFYRHEEQEIIIPRIYGVEVKKTVSSTGHSKRRTWTENEILADAKLKLSAEQFHAYHKLFEFCKENADQINFGTGAESSFSPIFLSLCSMSLITVNTSYPLSCNFGWVGKINKNTALLLKEKMEGIGFSFPDDYMRKRPGIPTGEWMPKVDEVINALAEML